MGLKYYSYMKDTHLSELLRKSSIKTENMSMSFSYSICQDCPDTVRSTGAYIIFYKGNTIYHDTHVPGPVSQSSA